MTLRFFQKQQFKNKQKKPVTWLELKPMEKLRKFKKNHDKIIKRHLKMRIIKKNQKKDIYLQKKGKKVLMN